MDNVQVLAMLRIETPDEPERVIPVAESPFNIGRSKANQLQLPHDRVSRHHARLLFEGDQIRLVDLKSSNGTQVGKTKLTPNDPYTLSYHETFSIGPYVLRLEATPEVAAQETAEPVAGITVGVEEMPVLAVAQEVGSGTPGLPEAPPADLAQPSDDDLFGLPANRSRYLQYLPPIYRDDPFLGRFLLAFEGVLLPVEQVVDNFDLYLDPRTVPPLFLDQLASWLALTLDEKWPIGKRRAVVAEAAALYRRRGTRWSLSRILEIYTGVVPKIIEPEDQAHHFDVVLRIPKGQHVDRPTVERIIETNKPAHTTYTLKIQPAGN
ncbi:MAG: FHA domain-containing protein [Chloroflexi bacterium]|nr:FHA domain-containing protein [Chloroflexota bacterium]